ncbi:hypothetical protein [Tenacibaculum geojense]|uniref:Thioredoxin domain-containing protein n=1 Tax=Tenacibaculum geojense TaxID=915352 RepID=A0ABW3JT02_9FLAO
MTKYILPLLTIFFLSCSKSPKKEFTYFGGKIINPKTDFVVLFDNEKPLDTIKLKNDHTFMGKLKGIHSGLYYFKHGPEHQFVYLEPNDSLLIRLNTWDFDESLVFSGVNADRNNVLIEAFLQTEIDQRNFYKYYTLQPEQFKLKVDSLLNRKANFIEDYKLNNNETSEQFLKTLSIALNYPIYTKIENYIAQKKLKNLPDNFANHRELTNINLDSLMFFGTYYRYVQANLYGEVYQNDNYKTNDDYTVALLNDIDKKIVSEKSKNRMLRRAAIRHFYDKSSCHVNKQMFDTFLNLTSDNEDKEEMKRLLNDIYKLNKNKQLPDFKMVSPQGAIENVSELAANKKTIIYFRNSKRSSKDWVAKRINYLVHNNPDKTFLVVNMDTKKEYVPNLDIKLQYYLTSDSEAREFLTSKLPRVVLVDENGIVVNGFASLSSEKINSQIKEL